jgi:hypothetical protein
MTYSEQLTKALRAWQGWTYDEVDSQNGPQGWNHPEVLWDEIHTLPPIAIEDLRELSRAAALHLPIWPREAEEPAEGWYQSDDGSGEAAYWNGMWLESLLDFHPAGSGSGAWGQALVVADAVANTDADPWASFCHWWDIPNGWESAEVAWIQACDPKERGPWLCLAILKATK